MKRRGFSRFRQKGNDYRLGSYFVTICCQDRICHFGEVVGGEAVLSDVGIRVKECWQEIPQHFPNVTLGEYVVMPNHFHGVLHLSQEEMVNYQPNEFGPLVKGSLSVVVGSFKAAVTRWSRRNGHEGFGWQGRYHERGIRNAGERLRIEEYIRKNPSNWPEDDFHPANCETQSLRRYPSIDS